MPNALNICHLNVRSLMSNFGDFKNFVSSYHVIAITETWLTADVEDVALSIPGFKLFRLDRTRTRGGGVAVYVNTDILCSQYDLNLKFDENIEQLWIHFKIKNCKIAIGNIYRPPSGDFQNFLNSIDDSLSLIIPTVDEIICLGDMNVNLLNPGNALTKCFDAYGFEQLINEPTRITDRSLTLLDPIFVSNAKLFNDSRVLDAGMISDHCLVCCKLHIEKQINSARFCTFRDFKNFDYTKFCGDLVITPFQNIINIPNIDDKLKIFNDLIISLFNKHAPVRTVRVNKRKCPWLTYPIKLMIKERDFALTKYKKSKSTVDWDRYKELRNYTLSAIRREKKKPFSTIYLMIMMTKYYGKGYIVTF